MSDRTLFQVGDDLLDDGMPAVAVFGLDHR
jgi:hypothetical protein